MVGGIGRCRGDRVVGSVMWEGDLSPFGVRLVFEGERAVISLVGEVDVATGVALVDAATSAVARYRFVDIDLGAATAIDDAGLRSLLKVQRFADAHGALVSVVGAAGPVAERVSEHFRNSMFGHS